MSFLSVSKPRIPVVLILFLLSVTRSSLWGDILPSRSSGAGPENAIPTGDVIFSESALESPWSDVRSWSVTRNYSSNNPVYTGATSGRFVHSPWGALQFTKGSWGTFQLIDNTLYSALSFALHGGSTGVTLKVSCHSPSGSQLMPAVTVSVPANTWELKTIPMSQLASTSFDAIRLTAQGAQVTFSLDEVTLVLAGSSEPPPPPVLLAPSDGETVVNLSPTLQWSPSAGANGYRLQVALDTAFTQIEIDDSTITGTNLTVGPLSDATTYFWRVAAIGDGGSSPFSSTFSFLIEEPPPVVQTKIMPLGDSITELDWQGGYRSRLYKLLTDSGYVFDFVGTKTTNHNDADLGFAFPQAYWDHEGYNSATIDNAGSTWIWLNSIRTKLMANPPDIVLLLLGTNDVYSGSRTAEQIRNNMSALLDSIWSFDGSIKVLLSAIPRTFDGNGTYLSIIQQVNALYPGLASEKIAQGRYIALVDNYSALTTSGDVLPDGIHPSVQGYIKIANAWYGDVVTAMETSVVPEPPSAPALSSPAQSAVNQPTNLALSWQGDIGATLHHLELATDAGFSTLIVNDSMLTTTSYNATGLLNETQYYWRVRSRNDAGWSGYSSTRSFTTVPVIPPPSGEVIYSESALASPWGDVRSWSITRNYGSTSPVYVGSTSARFVHSPWASLQFAKGTWNAFVDTDPSPFGELSFALHGGSAGVTLKVSCLSPSGAVLKPPVTVSSPADTWQGVTIPMISLATSPFLAIQFTAEGASVTFSMDELMLVYGSPPEPPAPPVQSSPADSSTVTSLTPTLAWNAVTGATQYRLQVAADTSFQNLVLHDSTVTGTSRVSPVLAENTVYYWRLSATNVGGEGMLGSRWSFTTVDVPDAPNLVFPSDGAADQPTSLQFAWTQASGAVSYQFQLSSDTAFIELTVNDSSLTDTSRSVSSLTQGATYYWRVASLNGPVRSPYTARRSVTIIAPPPPTGETVYSETALPSPWTDVRSWSITRNYGSTSPVYTGSTALRVVHNPWGALLFTKGTWGTFQNIDPSIYSSLTFALHGGGGGVTLKVNAQLASGAAAMSPVTVSSPANTWQVKTIAMNQLASVPFQAIKFTAEGASVTFSMDEVILILSGVPGTPPEEQAVELPADFVMHPNYPNPFNPTTTIRFDLPVRAQVRVTILNILGQPVATLVDEEMGAGEKNIVWSASIASGIYIARLEAVGVEDQTSRFVGVRRMVLLK